MESGLKLLFLTALRELCKHPVITQTASKISIFLQPSAFWTHSGGITKRSVGALREESSSSCAWVYAPPLLMVCGALDPRLHLLIWLNTGSMTAMSPGRPFTSLRGVDESSGLWERETLISFAEQSASCPPHLLLVGCF